MHATFDNSLNLFIRAIKSSLPSPEQFKNSIFIRDISGKLSVILPDEIDKLQLQPLEKAIRDQVGNYARDDDLIETPSSLGVSTLISEAESLTPFELEGTTIRVIDRRAIGLDWLSPAPTPSAKIPRIVFASIKGGVGRSTALCVAATHLSGRGLRVLAIDFDLEAPGLGSILLSEKELPPFGSLDFLVESQINGPESIPLSEMTGSSHLGAAGGRVDVIPAIGKHTLNSPENAIGKIARAYLDTFDERTLRQMTLGDKLRALIERYENTNMYDAILIDSRAGLHESTAACIISTGGDILLFGTNQPQTFQGIKLLLAHISNAQPLSKYDWTEKLTFVHAKAHKTEKNDANSAFNDAFNVLYKPIVQQITPQSELNADDIIITWDEANDDIAILPPDDADVLHIDHDENYIDFNPLLTPATLDSDNYSESFKELIDFLDASITTEA